MGAGGVIRGTGDANGESKWLVNRAADVLQRST